MTLRNAFLVLILLAGAAAAGESSATAADPKAAEAPASAPRAPDVIYVPTPPEVVEAMLRVAEVGPDDVLYDLGSGDGRIPITAVQRHGVRRAVGVEIDPDRIKEAEASREKAAVGDRVRFLNADLFQTPIGDATVVTLYLLPSLNVKLLPKLLAELKPGTRVVSHAFRMGSWQPEQTLRVDGREIHFWRIPRPGTPEHAAASAAAGRASR